MSDELNNIEHSPEFFGFYRALAAIQTAAIEYVRAGTNEENQKERAKKVTQAFQYMTKSESYAEYSDQPSPMFMLSQNGCDERCWDPISKNCIDCP